MFVRESQGLTMEWKEDRHFVCEKTCSFFSLLTVKCIHFRRRDTNPLHIKEIQGDRMAIILTLMLLRDITIPSVFFLYSFCIPSGQREFEFGLLLLLFSTNKLTGMND